LALASAAQQRNQQFPDGVIPGHASGTALEINKGDWVVGSGHYVLARTTANADYRLSGLGIALANNPYFDVLGNKQVQTALPIATQGIFRVSGMSAISASALVGYTVLPNKTGFGMIGQTGATGMAAQWLTAPQHYDASGITARAPSGVARIVRVVSVGSTAQWDIQIFPGQEFAMLGGG